MNEQPTTYNLGSLGLTVTVANVLVAVILVVGMVYDEQSVTAAVITGAGYFTFSTGLTVFALSRTLTDVVINWQIQVTERKRLMLHYNSVQVTQVAPTLPRLPGGPLQIPSFVSPVDEGPRREAVAYAMQLYDRHGSPDGSKVLLKSKRETPGRLRIAAPGGEATEYLVSKGVLLDVGNGYKLNLEHFPEVGFLKGVL